MSIVELKEKYIQLRSEKDNNSLLSFEVGLTKENWQEFLSYNRNSKKEQFEIEPIDGTKRGDIIEVQISPDIRIRGKVLSTVYGRTICEFIK